MLDMDRKARNAMQRKRQRMRAAKPARPVPSAKSVAGSSKGISRRAHKILSRHPGYLDAFLVCAFCDEGMECKQKKRLLAALEGRAEGLGRLVVMKLINMGLVRPEIAEEFLVRKKLLRYPLALTRKGMKRRSLIVRDELAHDSIGEWPFSDRASRRLSDKVAAA